jgi:CBS domain containing-hemolysin-like protein
MTLLLLYLAIAIGISFLCSVLEAVLLSVTPSYVETLQTKAPNRSAKLVQVKKRLDESLACILILNTFAHTMGAAGVGSQALQVFGPEWETLIAVLLTLVILYFSEIIPKTLGAIFWRQLAIPAAYVISWLRILVFPLVWVSTRLTKVIGKKQGDEITREEIIALASLGEKGGTLGGHENTYLTNALNLRKIRTKEIFTPRSVVHMLQADMTVKEALDLSETRQFTRMPVHGESIDDIVGKVIRADLFEAERNGQGAQTVREYMKPIKRVSQKLPVHQLIDLFIRQKLHLFLVEDEFGQPLGVVTLEDAIETLLGREIVDERDTVTDMQELARSKFRDRNRDSN